VPHTGASAEKHGAPHILVQRRELGNRGNSCGSDTSVSRRGLRELLKLDELRHLRSCEMCVADRSNCTIKELTRHEHFIKS